MDTIVSLCRRRGFVFPSSEIYGGLGSTYDYGHYGVLTKKQHPLRSGSARWCRSATTSSPSTPRSSSPQRSGRHPAHVAGFTDPLVDCRTCKLRSAPTSSNRRTAASSEQKRPGETPDCASRAQAVQPMFETHVGALQDESSAAYLRRKRRRASSSTSKNVAQLARREAAVRHIAQVGKSVPERDHGRATSSSACASSSRLEMEFFVPPADATQWFEYWLDQRLGWQPQPRASGRATPGSRARRSGALALLQRDERHRYLYPIGWQELEGVANGATSTHAAHAALGHEARVDRPRRQPLHAVRDRARREHRAHLRRAPLRRLPRGGRRRP